MPNTITDNYQGDIEIIDMSRYSELTIDEKKLFEKIRNSVLETFPLSGKKFDTDTIKFGENFSFIMLPGVVQYVDKITTDKITALEEKLNIQFDKLDKKIDTMASTTSASTTSTESSTSKTTVAKK